MSREFNRLFLELYNLRKQNKDLTLDKLAPEQLANLDGIIKTIADLLENGADPNIKDIEGRTPLLFAIAMPHPSIEKETKSDHLADMLLNKGANPNITSYNGTSPLLLATIYNNPYIVKRLLVKGANPQPDGDLKPLEIAKEQHYSTIEKMLLQAIRPSPIRQFFSTISKTLKK